MISSIIKKFPNCTFPCGERAALVALQPCQLLKGRSPDHASAPTSKQLLAWFSGIRGTRREQHILLNILVLTARTRNNVSSLSAMIKACSRCAGSAFSPAIAVVRRSNSGAIT